MHKFKVSCNTGSSYRSPWPVFRIRISVYKSFSKHLRNINRMTVFQKSKCNTLKVILSFSTLNSTSIPPTSKSLFISNLVPVNIPPSPPAHLARPPAGWFITSLSFKHQIIPKLRNIKIELTYVEEDRDMVDLNKEHILVLSRIISKLEQLYQT